MKKMLVVCNTDSMIWNFLVPYIKEMISRGIEVECACARTGEFIDDLRNIHKLIVHEIEFERSPYKIKNFFAFNKLNKLVKEERFDTIFCHSPVGGVMGRIVGTLNNCKIIYMAHGFHFYKGAPKSYWAIYYPIERILSYFTDVLITMNEEDHEYAKKFGAKKIYKINGIGVDTDTFIAENREDYIRKEFKIDKDATILLSVGELIERKNHKVVIEAIKELKNKKIFYFIAGRGPLYDSLNNTINEYGLSDNVFLLGFRRDIDALCHSTDIFIFPSLQEGLPMALMEAMAMGKPVIVSNIRGNRDLIVDGEGGLLVDRKSVKEYVESINKLVNDKKMRLSMGEMNAKNIHQYSIESIKKQLLRILLDI